MGTVLMKSPKKATSDLSKIKVFWKKYYDVISFVVEVTIKILSHDSNYIVDAVTWPKFGNSNFCMKEVIITSSLQGFYQKKLFFRERSCFKFNNLGLTLGINLKFYFRVAKRLKLNVRKFWGLIPAFVEITGEKLVGWSLFASYSE